MSKEYFDCKNRKFEEGDIVFNPFFGDYWVVFKYTKKEQLEEETDCPYYFAQYGYKDLYYMDIDEPVGFLIVCKKGEPHYDQYFKEFADYKKKLEEEEK